VIDLSISTFLITLFNIGILFIVLRGILFKRVTAFMESRTNKIRRTIEEAEKDKQSAKALLQEYEERLKNLQSEAQDIVRRAEEKACKEAERITEEGKQTAAALIAGAHKQIEAEQRAAMSLFRAEAAALVISASSRLLQRELTQEDSRQFASLLLRELGTR
jgi:F-type H+-transporting ATPase subunit b